MCWKPFFWCFQAEEDSLLCQQFTAAENNGQIEGRLRPYVDQVRLVIVFPVCVLCFAANKLYLNICIYNKMTS